MFENIFLKKNKDQILNDIKDIQKLHELLKDFDMSIFRDLPEENFEYLKQTFKESGYSLDDFSKRIEQVMEDVIDKNMTFKDAFGLSEDHLEAFYFLGFELFKKEKFSEALHMFKTLSIFEPFNWRYIYASATTMHRQKNFEGAIKAYLLSSTMDPEKHSPLPHYHSADCYISLNDVNSAILALGIAMSFCNQELEEHKIIYNKSKLLKSALEEKMLSGLKG